MLSKKPDSAPLCLNSGNGAFDLARQSVENSKNWLAANNFDVVEHYIRGHLEVVCRKTPPFADGGYHYLILRAVPHPRDGNATGQPNVLHREAANYCEYGPDESVFAGIADLVEGPQQVIPSGVWLKRNHQIEDFRRKLIGVTSGAASSFSLVVPERERALFPPPSAGPSDDVADLVQRRAEISKSVIGVAADAAGQGLHQLNLQNFLLGARVVLSRQNVGLATKEGSEIVADSLSVALGVLKPILRTVEGVNLG